MTTPTREQVIEWAKEAHIASAPFWRMGFFPDRFAEAERLCALAMSAGRDQGLREASNACEVKARGFELTAENMDLDVYHAKASAARSCAAAIEQLRGK